MIGKVFGRLVVVEQAGSNKHQKRLWRCKCSCGKTAIVIGGQLTAGRTKSCGCLLQDYPGRLAHGHRRRGNQTRTYTAWVNLRQRCCNPKSTSYHNYGARGITYDSQWNSFEVFLQDMGEMPEGLSLERVDNAGAYCKRNCRWATRKEQALNTRQNRRLSLDGQTFTIREWADKLRMPYSRLISRLFRGWPVERALRTGLLRKPTNMRIA